MTYKDSRAEKKTFEENFVASADSNFFKVFKIPFVKGSAETALTKPNNLVVTATTAKRYLGDEDSIGKTLDVGGGNFTVVKTSMPTTRPSSRQENYLPSLRAWLFWWRVLGYLTCQPTRHICARKKLAYEK